MKIHFHTLRHWKGTVEYRKHGLMYVKELLGHKSVKNTERYIHLANAIFNTGSEGEYYTRTTKTVKGARALIANGYEYVTDVDDFKLFRKRK